MHADVTGTVHGKASCDAAARCTGALTGLGRRGGGLHNDYDRLRRFDVSADAKSASAVSATVTTMPGHGGPAVL
jgi:hypothetical protein